MYGNDYTFVTFTWQTADFVFVKRSFPLNMRLSDTTVCDQYMKLFVHLTEFKPALTFTVKSYLLIHSLVEILLTLWPPKVISMKFLLTISRQNHTWRSWE